jgi:arsenate reductase (thioredoxin)
MKKKIIVLCTANSCRSQIAHGYLNHFGGNKVEVYSAGVEAHGVNPGAIQTMKEDGIDISNHTSNHVDEYLDKKFDYVITVCESAKETCPYIPATIKNLHQDFPDPAKAKGTEEEIKKQFRHTRDLIKNYIHDFVKDELK